MALCSSAYNPLVAFTKHTYDDREVYRDRLISKTDGPGRGSFRSGRYNEHTQVTVAEHLLEKACSGSKGRK
jgi:hypothetical protein